MGGNHGPPDVQSFYANENLVEVRIGRSTRVKYKEITNIVQDSRRSNCCPLVKKRGNTMKSKSWLVIFLIFLLIAPAFAGDPGPRDVKGIPKKNRYIWAIAGGTALGAGIGLLAPGGNKSVAKGALIGGSGASLIYLMGHPRVVSNAWRPWVAVATNTALGTGIGWTACNCNSGAGIGALIGGGGTVLIQGFRSSHRGLSKAAGVPPAPSPSSATNPSH